MLEENFKKIFRRGADPNHFLHFNNLPTQKQEKVNPLMFAAKKGDLQLVDTILRHKPNINNKDVYNRNALFYAISAEKGDNADIILTLIKNKININDTEISYNQKGFEGHSPLTLATKLNLKYTVKALLENNANIDYQIPVNGNSALHFAVINSNIEMVKMLIAHKANIEVKNKENKNAIQLAMENTNNTEIYTLLAEETNKLNEEKEKIAQEIMRREAEEAANNNLNMMHSGNLGSLLSMNMGKSSDLTSSSNNKKSNKKNKKENQSANRDSNLNEKKASANIENSEDVVNKEFKLSASDNKSISNFKLIHFFIEKYIILFKMR